jgi:hypothetical protein
VASRRSSVETQLRDRLRYFLGTPWRGRREVVTTLERLSLYGEVLIFGGMLRDLLLRGNAGFDSDIDVVLVGANHDQVEKALAPLDAQRNRFGGYRLAKRHWKLDVWHLEDTWAFQQALVAPVAPDQLVHTTFFTWDAAVFSMSSGSVWLHDQFQEHVVARILDINLAPNPNPEGAALRAVRAVVRDHARMTSAVAKYVLEAIDESSVESLVQREGSSYADRLLTEPILRDIQKHLRAFVARPVSSPLRPPLYQYSLELSEPK